MPILGLPQTKVPEKCQVLLIIVPSTCLSDTSNPTGKWAPGGSRRAAAQLPPTHSGPTSSLGAPMYHMQNKGGEANREACCSPHGFPGAPLRVGLLSV